MTVTGAQRTEPDASPTARLLAAASFLAAVALVLVVPLVVDSRALEMFRGPKGDLALAGWGVLAAIFAVANLGGRAWRDRWWAAWGGVAAGGAVSALACPAPARSLASLAPLVLVALGWGAIRQLSDGQRRSLARLVVWAGVIEAALVFAYLSPAWRPESFALLGDFTGRYAWIGSLGNPGDVAVFLALPALLAAERALAARRHRIVWTGAAAFTAAALLGTRTLTGAAALFAGVLVMVWRNLAPRRRLPALGALLVATALVFTVTPYAKRVAGAIHEVRSGGILWLGTARAAAYAAAGAMLGARPATGVGFDLFEANSFRYQSPDALADRGRVLGLVTGFGAAHNDVLQYAAETGVAGVLLAAAGLAFALRRRPAGAGAVVDAPPLLAAALVLALTQFPLHLAAIASQWAVLAALALPPLPPAPAPAGWRGRARLLAVGILVGAAGTVAWQRFRAAEIFQEGKAMVTALHSTPPTAALRVELARSALDNLRLRARWLPYSWEATVILGNVAIEAGDTRAALASFGRALALADRPEVRFDIAMAMLLAGDREGGMHQLVQAVHLNPAIFREIKDPALARDLRRRLDSSGYGARHPWMYEGTPAAQP